jgi:signal transduction histidine kinase
MKIDLILIEGAHEGLVSVAIEAARSVFPEGQTTRVNSFEDALHRDAAAVPEILVLTHSNESEIARATAALDGFRLPRWAVVAVGKGPVASFAEVIPDEEWNIRVLARAFRSAMDRHRLRRDNQRLLGDLLSVGIRITHDLRTPLGGILSATEELNEFLVQNAPAGKALSRPIIESTEDLVKIIGQLTLLAKASARPSQSQSFNMALAVGRVLERLEGRILRRGAVVLKPESWPDVSGDSALTESVWLCLADNALLHAGEKPRLELAWEPSEDGYRFWIHDNGGGVAPEKRRSLFQPFHRLHEANAVRGLGLPIVERLVSLQGGSCGYRPGGGAGSSFYFTLPASSEG